MQQSKSNSKSLPRLLLSLATVTVVGCADTGDSGMLEQGGSSLTESQWTFCADNGEDCTFDGTHQVRYGAYGKFKTGTFTDGVHCSGWSFGTRSRRRATCEVLLDVDVEASQPPSDTTPGASTGSDTTPSTSEDAGSMPMDMSDSGSGATMPSDMNTGSSGNMYMPYVDMSALPTGNPGVSDVEIRPTSEKPVPADIGAFRTSCSFSHMSKDDPIVFPGQPGRSHLHAFFGNTLADANSTSESLRSSGNSTCRGGIANRSAYWVPAVIDKNGKPITPQSAQVYYKTGYNGIAPRDVNVFPQGLRMVAGDAKMTGPGQPHSYWSCETYNGHPNAIPDCGGERVLMAVQFPQCWNGRDLDSADHKSHMAYPENGRCPSTHPVAIPEISFNIYYVVPAGTRSSEWRLVSDMYDSSLPGGYSSHGDWFEGWDRQVAETFVKYCDQASMDCHSHLLGDGREIYNNLEPWE